MKRSVQLRPGSLVKIPAGLTKDLGFAALLLVVDAHRPYWDGALSIRLLTSKGRVLSLGACVDADCTDPGCTNHCHFDLIEQES